MEQKKGLLPIIVLLIACTALSLWVWKHVPLQTEATVGAVEMELYSFDLSALTEENKPIILNLVSDSCPYCVIMEPEMKVFYQQYSDIATIRQINLDRVPEVALQLPSRATPTQFFFYADGTPYLPSEDLQQQMMFLSYIEQDTEAHLFTVHEGMLTAEQMAFILQDLGAQK